MFLFLWRLFLFVEHYAPNSVPNSLIVSFCIAIEGYILIVRNVHEEAQDSDVLDAFADFGEVKNMQLGFNRRNGYCKVWSSIDSHF